MNDPNPAVFRRAHSDRRVREALAEIPGSIPLKAWKVQYVSTDVTYQRVAATGTVIVPTAPWTGAGTRPLVAFVPGTLGLGP